MFPDRSGIRDRSQFQRISILAAVFRVGPPTHFLRWRCSLLPLCLAKLSPSASDSWFRLASSICGFHCSLLSLYLFSPASRFPSRQRAASNSSQRSLGDQHRLESGPRRTRNLRRTCLGAGFCIAIGIAGFFSSRLSDTFRTRGA